MDDLPPVLSQGLGLSAFRPSLRSSLICTEQPQPVAYTCQLTLEFRTAGTFLCVDQSLCPRSTVTISLYISSHVYQKTENFFIPVTPNCSVRSTSVTKLYPAGTESRAQLMGKRISVYKYNKSSMIPVRINCSR
jgi:hypothetical protein